MSLERRVSDVLRQMPVDYVVEPSKEQNIADLIKLLEKAESEMRDAWLRADRLRKQLVKLKS